MLSGQMRVAEWKRRQEPWLQVRQARPLHHQHRLRQLRHRAVNTDDPRIKGSCVVILEDTDEGTFDHGPRPRSWFTQLFLDRRSIFNLKVPAHRIVAIHVKHGVIVPNYSHSEIIEAVFRRTRVAVGVMTAAKLLSASSPSSATSAAVSAGPKAPSPAPSATRGHPAARGRSAPGWSMSGPPAKLPLPWLRHRPPLRRLDPIEKLKTAILLERGVQGGRAEMKALRESEQRAISSTPSARRPGRADWRPIRWSSMFSATAEAT